MQNLDEILETFELIEDWEERYRLLIDLGKKLPDLADELHRDEFLVKGCTSKVWMVPEIRNGRFYFQADSDAHIVKGLVALLYVIFNNISVGEIGAIDIDATFKKLGLDQNLSPNRRNGFYAMVEKIRSYSA
ncbi:MAG TPA: SufE family protein [Alphaproteobacteria bacterium]|nr:SufE family protein [Alphaproteobacteria bacterium]HNS45053.1 SufE family protein [Alphaproteobacteria bacterium]